MGEWGLVTVFCSSIAIAGHTFFMIRKAPPGWERLYLALPLLPPMYLLPLIFDYTTQPASVALTFWIISWLGSFKVVTFCFGRGILADPWNQQSFLRFYLALNLPLHIKPRLKNAPPAFNPSQKPDGSEDSKVIEGSNNREARFMEAAKLLATSALVGALFYGNLQLYSIPDIPVLAMEAVHCISMLLFMALICDSAAAFTIIAADITIEPHFNKPYLSRSFQDFWSRRWNVTVSSCFRDAVYVPVVEALGGQKAGQRPSQLKGSNSNSNSSSNSNSNSARLWGVLATFFVSGIVHELLLLYVALAVTGEMMFFFLLHGCLVCAEALLRQQGYLKGISIFISVPFTVLTTFITAHFFFFPPFTRNQVPMRVVHEVKSWFELIL